MKERAVELRDNPLGKLWTESSKLHTVVFEMNDIGQKLLVMKSEPGLKTEYLMSSSYSLSHKDGSDEVRSLCIVRLSNPNPSKTFIRVRLEDAEAWGHCRNSYSVEYDGKQIFKYKGVNEPKDLILKPGQHEEIRVRCVFDGKNSNESVTVALIFLVSEVRRKTLPNELLLGELKTVIVKFCA